MAVKGERIGAGIGGWEFALDWRDVERVQIAMAACTPPGYFVHAGEQYFRDKSGSIHKRVGV